VPPRQLPLSLPHRPSLGRADFLTGDANAAAIAFVDRWPEWPARPVLLHGPAGSGKTHLTEIWRAASGAEAVGASELSEESAVLAGSQRAFAVEDLHNGPLDEAALFHLLNLAAERGTVLLLTSRVPASALPITLPDLASRLRAALPLELAAPDDELLRRVLIKLFADRQLTLDRAVADFIVTRMERSLEAANLIVERLDHEALAAGRPITVRFAAEALRPLFEGEVDAGRAED
jgi:chromosomal replication initiation ATPase DnaA